MTHQKNRSASYGISISGTITFTSGMYGNNSYNLLHSNEEELNIFRGDKETIKSNPIKSDIEEHQDTTYYSKSLPNTAVFHNTFDLYDVRLLDIRQEDSYTKLYLKQVSSDEVHIHTVLNNKNLNPRLLQFKKKRMLFVYIKDKHTAKNLIDTPDLIITSTDTFPLFSHKWYNNWFYTRKCKVLIQDYQFFLNAVSRRPYKEEESSSIKGSTKSIMLDAILARKDLTTKQKKKQIAEMNAFLDYV